MTPHLSQEQRLIEILTAAHGAWVPMYVLAQTIGSYNIATRASCANKWLRLNNRLKIGKVPEIRNWTINHGPGQKESFYRLEK